MSQIELLFFLFVLLIMSVSNQESIGREEVELKSFRSELANGRAENAEVRDSLKCERSQVYKLRDVAQELRSLLDSGNDTLNQSRNWNCWIVFTETKS